MSQTAPKPSRKDCSKSPLSSAETVCSPRRSLPRGFQSQVDFLLSLPRVAEEEIRNPENRVEFSLNIPLEKRLSDEEVLASGKPLNLSSIKDLDGYKEFEPGPELVEFLQLFFYGVVGGETVPELSEDQIELLRVVLGQRASGKHNQWLQQQIRMIDGGNYLKVCAVLQERIKIHKSNISSHFVFSKLAKFSEGKPELGLLSGLDLPRNMIFNVRYFSRVFAQPGFKEIFRSTTGSEEFRRYLIAASIANFKRSIKSILYAAKLSLCHSQLRISQKVNLGLTKAEIDRVLSSFKKYLL